ncbi:MAG: uracil-DNA glycosylase [Candidatus Omnitrophica bacterium]|nr:uracil-DNA glycosylase [Candidatus Omnitrophota bacterium]
MDPIRREALACRKCRLCEGRTHVVFGEGSLNASIVFVGEGPGRDEDAQGRPFIGAAGGLLTKMITAMGLTRESVYIANVVKCRPPMNRPPQPDEVAACAPYLAAQLTTIAPKIICALGKTAAAALLQSNLSIAQMRGKVFAWQGTPVVVTFHPAYLLRNPNAKPDAWKDLQRLLHLLAP